MKRLRVTPESVKRIPSRSTAHLIESGIHESRKLAELRDYLLAKLLSGEVRVKDTEQLLEATE